MAEHTDDLRIKAKRRASASAYLSAYRRAQLADDIFSTQIERQFGNKSRWDVSQHEMDPETLAAFWNKVEADLDSLSALEVMRAMGATVRDAE